MQFIFFPLDCLSMRFNLILEKITPKTLIGKALEMIKFKLGLVYLCKHFILLNNLQQSVISQKLFHIYINFQVNCVMKFSKYCIV